MADISQPPFDPVIRVMVNVRVWRVDYTYNEGAYPELTYKRIFRTWGDWVITQNTVLLKWTGPHSFEETWPDGWKDYAKRNIYWYDHAERAYDPRDFVSETEWSKMTAIKTQIGTGRFNIGMGSASPTSDDAALAPQQDNYTGVYIGAFNYYDNEYWAILPEYVGVPTEDEWFKTFTTRSEAEEMLLPERIEQWWQEQTEFLSSNFGYSHFSKSDPYEVDPNTLEPI